MPSAIAAVRKAGSFAGFGLGAGAGSARAASRFTEVDEGLLWLAALILLTGLVMVYSSSIAFAEGSKFTGYLRSSTRCPFVQIARHISIAATSGIGG